MRRSARARERSRGGLPDARFLLSSLGYSGGYKVQAVMLYGGGIFNVVFITAGQIENVRVKENCIEYNLLCHLRRVLVGFAPGRTLFTVSL